MKYIITAIFTVAAMYLFVSGSQAMHIAQNGGRAAIQTDEGGQPFDEWYGPEDGYSPENPDRNDIDAPPEQPPVEPVEQDTNRADPNPDKFKDERRKSG